MTTVGLHNLELNETLRKKARWEILKNAAYCFVQILEATTHKTVAVQPLAAHLISHPSKKNKICRALLEK